MKPILSWTVLNNLHISPHSYICKVMNCEVPENEYMVKGKAIHKVLQDHLMGKVKLDKLGSNYFGVCQSSEYHCRRDYGNYMCHGYIDSLSFKTKTFYEIKSSTKPWSQSKFNELIQAPYYSFVSGFKNVVYIACTYDMSDIKFYTRTFTADEIEKVKPWIDEAIKIIDTGAFFTDLENGVCVNPACPYNSACFFRSGSNVDSGVQL